MVELLSHNFPKKALLDALMTLTLSYAISCPML